MAVRQSAEKVQAVERVEQFREFGVGDRIYPP
jgi:hypothetical protein